MLYSIWFEKKCGLNEVILHGTRSVIAVLVYNTLINAMLMMRISGKDAGQWKDKMRCKFIPLPEQGDQLSLVFKEKQNRQAQEKGREILRG